MADSTIEVHLSRLENLFVTAGDMMLKTAELSRQNAEQIEQNSRQIEQNSRQLTQLERTMAQLALPAATDRAEFEAFVEPLRLL